MGNLEESNRKRGKLRVTTDPFMMLCSILVLEEQVGAPPNYGSFPRSPDRGVLPTLVSAIPASKDGISVCGILERAAAPLPRLNLSARLVVSAESKYCLKSAISVVAWTQSPNAEIDSGIYYAEVPFFEQAKTSRQSVLFVQPPYYQQ
jgi:hypothetical protein